MTTAATAKQALGYFRVSGPRQVDVAVRVGIPANRLSEIESGRREASPELLERLLEVIAVTGSAGPDGDRVAR